MWESLASELELLNREGDAKLTWSFDTSLDGIREHWFFSEAPSERVESTLRDLLKEAGTHLPTAAGGRMFPQKLLAEPASDRRWFAALRHARVNVMRLQPKDLRTDRGMIFDVAAASVTLCRRLAKLSARSPSGAQ